VGKNNKEKRKAKKKVRDSKRRSLPIAQQVRPCDGCTECCSVFGVEEIDKDPWVPCDQLSHEGCGIYETRPKQCRTFHCLWQNGMGSQSDRPDKLGVIYAPTNGKTEFTKQQEIQAYEIEVGAFDNQDVIKLSQRFVDRGRLVIGHTYDGESMRFMGPPKKIAKAEKWAANNKKAGL
jgi:hypothetical protein